MLTVSLGSSSVYNLRPDFSGFLPVPFLGSFFLGRPSSNPPGVSNFLPVLTSVS